MKKVLNIFFIWAVFLFLGILVFQFLHECGHGLGSQLEGEHVSTAFNRVGDPGKQPSDPDFRLHHIIQGRWNLGSFFGPFSNWIFLTVFTSLLLLQRKAGSASLFFGAGAAVNGLMRLIPMLNFFIQAFQGRLILEDEVAWGLSAVPGLAFPMPFENFKVLASAQPLLFLHEPKIYFWPAVSLAISIIGLILIFRRLNQFFLRPMRFYLLRWLFVLLPFLIWPLTFILTNKLDNLVRLNW